MKVEFVDLCGLRVDGRRPGELRKVHAKLGVVSNATGSALLEQGISKVVASVSGPHECTQRSLEQHDRAVVNCRVIMAPFAASQSDRKKRRRTDTTLMEVATMVKQTLESVIFLELHPRAQIDVTLEVIQADGPVRALCINAATLALIDAGIAIKDFLTAASVGYVDGHLLLDVNHAEDAAKGPETCIAYLPNTDAIVTVNLEPKLPLEELPAVTELALGGCKTLYRHLQTLVLQHCAAQAEARGDALM
mmetsp:Transcript_54949/g.130466  ORF Transcript_54949/g.130466 Transcript_54949/m.130466 type:complete len:249 (-) Transcript_54949:41-787(-)